MANRIHSSGYLLVWSLSAALLLLTWPPAGAQQQDASKNAKAKKAKADDGFRTQGGGGNLEGYDPDDPRPAPRLADGKPDFSGVWTNLGGNLGQDPMPPFAPGGEAIFNVPRDPNVDDPTGFYCMPDGMPRQIVSPYPVQLVHKPGLLVFLYEYNHFFRIIPTTGEKLPEDPNPTWMGTSSARWEGDTLVIETAGFTQHEDHWFDAAGHRSSDALRITERMRRVNYSTILFDVIIDDPKVWTKPWTQHKRYALRPDWKLIEYICEENNRTAQRGLEGPRPRYNRGLPK